MIDRPIVRISPSDLDSLLSTLDLRVVALTECVVSSGYRLDMVGHDAPGLHYNLVGQGTMYLKGESAIRLAPHTLIILPCNSSFSLEATVGLATPPNIVDARLQPQSGPVRRFAAGPGEAAVILICGFFRARYGSSTDLFESLQSPIVERFEESHRLDQVLKSAMAELITQEIGSAAMSEALLKQVIVALVRRSISSVSLWVERFAMLRDPQVARAFSIMAADPGAPHDVLGLARGVGLSRSAFMARFTEVTGHTPMWILRGLRMRQAAQQLRNTNRSIEEIVRSVGYESRSSFVRAFRQAYGRDPSEYRATVGPVAERARVRQS